MKRLLILGILLLLVYPTIAYSDTGYVDPNGDSTPLQWSPIPGATHYTALDDGIRQPTAGGTADYITSSANGKIDIFDMSTLTVGSVSNVTVWAYNAGVTANCVSVSIYMGGGWTALTAIGVVSSVAWRSVSFNGTWTQSDLNAMQVKVQNTETNVPFVATVDSLYCVVTYTAGGGGGGGGTAPYKIKKKKGIFFIK